MPSIEQTEQQRQQRQSANADAGDPTLAESTTTDQPSAPKQTTDDDSINKSDSSIDLNGEQNSEPEIVPARGKENGKENEPNGAQIEEDEEKKLSTKADKDQLGVDLQLNGRSSRRVSVVSFREVCELYEIDLEKGERNREVIKSRPSVLQSVRYYVMFLALISPFVTTYSRTIINFAITDMIDPRFTQKQAENNKLKMTELTPNASRLLAFDIDNSCPVDEELRRRLIDEDSHDTKRAQTTSGEKFEWDAFSQGLLKAAYSYGHAFFQIPGSRLSEIYGSHLVISAGAILIGSCCLVAPFLASLHFYLLFVDLVLLGILGSFMSPAAITLFGNWLTPGEKSLMVSFMLVGSRLGYALSSFLCGQLLEAGISWRYVFYSSGWTGLVFGSSFLLLARSRPKDHPLVGKLELDYLASKNTLVRESLAEDSRDSSRKLEMNKVVTSNGQTAAEESQVKTNSKKRITGAPWLALATNAPVWTFVLTKFCVKLAGDLAHIELPSYLKRVMHYSAADNGKVNAWNYVIFCVGCLLVGSLAKYTIKRRPFGMSKTAIRKLFQSIASFGVATILVGIAFSVCDKASTEILLLSFFLVTTFGIAGEAQCPYDLSERYSGTIHAIGSSLAISGAIEPMLVGYFLRGRSADKDQWKYVWLGASAVSFIGGLVFLLFAEAEVQPFDRIADRENSSKSEPDDLDSDEKEENSDGGLVQQVDGDGKKKVAETAEKQRNQALPKDDNSVDANKDVTIEATRGVSVDQADVRKGSSPSKDENEKVTAEATETQQQNQALDPIEAYSNSEMGENKSTKS